MTREEQIDWLCRLRADLNNGVIFTPWNKEFTEVLNSVLEQEPCEDAISRQAVCDTTICDGISCNECSFNTCEDGQSGCLLKERISKLPPVTPQPKTGQWVKQTDGYSYFYVCYACGERVPKNDFGSNYFSPFCPECGAKMVESEDEWQKKLK